MPPAVAAPPTPRALILAAGIGRRLGRDDAAEPHLPPAAEPHPPKVLLRFGGRSLLARHLDILRGCGIADVTLVLGYRADDVRRELDALGGAAPAVLVNPDFREGSVVSLHAAHAVLRSGAPVVLMDGDVLYDSRLMQRLLDGAAANVLLLDRDIEPGDEPVKLCVRGGRIVDFHKRPQQAYEWHGESVGFFRFAPDAAAELADRAADYVGSGRRGMEYEEPIRDMMLASPADRFGFEDISGLPWTEIDFPEDVHKARTLLPALAA